jgi:hypothetical protein
MSSPHSFKRQRRTLHRVFNMSKTYKEQPRSKSSDKTPQKAIDRLRMSEAQEDIREALAPQEATSATT